MNEPAATPAPPRPRRRWLRAVALTLLALLLLLGAIIGWLLGSHAGLRFALAQAQSLTHGALSVANVQGRLIGPLTLKNLRYADGKGTDARVSSLRLDLRFWPLLRKRVHVLDLSVDGVQVDLPRSEPTQDTEQSSLSLKPPIALVLDHIHVGQLAIRQDHQPLFAADRFELAGSWTNRGIALRQLLLRAPDGRADLAGQLAIGKSYRGDGKADIAWKLGGLDYAGQLVAHSDGTKATAKIILSQPTAMQLDLQLTQSGDYAWNARLDAPSFNPKPLLGDSALTSLGLALQGGGDRHGGQLDGSVDLNDYQVRLQPLRAHFDDAYKQLTLEQLKLGSAQIPGVIQANGTVQLAAKPLSADLQLTWQNLQLPESLAGQRLDSHGELSAHGSAEQFNAEGGVAIGPPGQLAQLAVNLDGTPQQIQLHTLALKQRQGDFQAKGLLTLQPALGWQLSADARHFDPGQLLADWKGDLNMSLDTQGSMPAQGPDATLELKQLDGSLRGRPLSGQGRLHLSPAKVVDGQLKLRSGGSTIALDGKPGARNDLRLNLAIASLGDWLPEAGGRLDGDFHARGDFRALSVDGQLRGATLAYQDQRMQSLRLDATVTDISNPAGKLNLDIAGVSAGGLTFKQIALHGDGDTRSHKLSLNAQGQPLSTELALSGGLKNGAWNSNLSTLNIDLHGLPRWRLQQSSQLSWNDGSFSLSELCLTAGDPLLCLAAKQDKAGNLDASYRLQALPLALLMSAANQGDMPMRADGQLDGQGAIRRNAAGALSGKATIESPRGSVTYVEHPDQPLLSYSNLALQADLNPSSQRATLRAQLDQGGAIDGQVGLDGPQQALSGHLNVNINSLAFVELFTNEVAAVQGKAQGQFKFDGTLKQPRIGGQLGLNGLAAEVPSAGLKLDQGRIVISTQDAQKLNIDGGIRSGKGTLAITGNVDLGQNAQSAIEIKGSQFTAADIPAAKVVISPQLSLQQGAKGLDVGGSVLLDSADIDVSKLPGGGATQASPDVVVVDQQKQAEQAAQSPISANVKVDLGKKTHLVGFGLDGRLSGALTVSERPGHATSGQGQIGVDGTYKAYGQNLTIEQGQLLFASTPVDNPGLNIRAIRKLNPNATIDDGQKVGLYVSGTAQRPVLTVFSDPVMEQSDALSYLVTGKPLSEVRGGEGNMVGAAAQALGSAAGDLLAKSIGGKLGIDDIGVSNSDALGGSSAFTVGKYLSPRLYLSYGVGLFEPGQVITMRYRLSHHWNFEAQNATDFNRASLNYRIEK